MKHKWEHLVKATSILEEVLTLHRSGVCKNWDSMSSDELKNYLNKYSNQISLALEHLDNITV